MNRDKIDTVSAEPFSQPKSAVIAAWEAMKSSGLLSRLGWPDPFDVGWMEDEAFWDRAEVKYIYKLFNLDQMFFANGRPMGPIITAQDLIEHVPGFAELLEEVRTLRQTHLDKVRGPHHLVTWKLGPETRVKDRFELLVGFKANHPDPWVRTNRAYDVGLQALLDATLG